MRTTQTASLLQDDDPAPFWLDDPPMPTLGAASTSPAAGPLAQTLYLQEAGDTAPISIDDVHQGQIGDCFLVAVLGELALMHPGAIQTMIHTNADGTETVTIYGAHNASTPFLLQTKYDPHSVTITNSFAPGAVNSAGAQDQLGSQQEIWPQVLEKAVAMFGGGYSTISHGGLPAVVMAELTGHAPLRFAASSVTADMLGSFSSSRELIVLDTAARANLPDGLIGDHAYMFEGVVGAGAAASVKLGNPWGYDQPSLVPLSQLGRSFAEVDVGRVS